MLVVAVQAGKACWRVVMCSSEAHKLRATDSNRPWHCTSHFAFFWKSGARL